MQKPVYESNDDFILEYWNKSYSQPHYEEKKISEKHISGLMSKQVHESITVRETTERTNWSKYLGCICKYPRMFVFKSFSNILFIERSNYDIEIAFQQFRFGIDIKDFFPWYERNRDLFMELPRASINEEDRSFTFGDITRPIGAKGSSFLIRHTSDIYFSKEKQQFTQEISVFVLDDGSCE